MASCPPPCECEVVIVGAGVAGASAAFHLMEAGVRNMVVVDGGSRPGEGVSSERSGSAVMDDVAPVIKMMVQVFASSCDSFMSHHGREGAQRYLKLTGEGIEMQKALAQQVLENPQEQLVQMGSFYVGCEKDEEELRREFETLQSLGCSAIEWCNKERLQSVPGLPSEFTCAILFPNDAVIDSSSYAKGLLRVVQEKGVAHIAMETKVTRIIEQKKNDKNNTGALVELESRVWNSMQACGHGNGWTLPNPTTMRVDQTMLFVSSACTHLNNVLRDLEQLFHVGL